MDRDVEGGSGTFLLDGTWRQEDLQHATQASRASGWAGRGWQEAHVR